MNVATFQNTRQREKTCAAVSFVEKGQKSTFVYVLYMSVVYALHVYVLIHVFHKFQALHSLYS